MGLVSMRERAELIGGELQVRRPAEGGTAVRLRVVGCMDSAPARNEVA
jgi:signal transduction histidine kinase